MESHPAPRNLPREATNTASCPPGAAPFRAVEGDFYQVAQLVDATDQALLSRVRAFAEERVAPVINQYWGRAEFPFELIN